MATLITRADGNFTDAATWGTVAEGGSGGNACLLEQVAANGTSTLAANTTTDSSSFVLPNTAVDGLAVKIASVTAMTGNLTIILRNSTTSTNQGSVTIDSSVIPTNMTGWLLVPFSSFTPNGTDSYVVRITRAAGATGTLIMESPVTGGFARMIRTTTTASPGASDILVMCGEYAGSTTVNLRTITMNNTATTTFGIVQVGGKPAISINDKTTLDWANSSSTNYYLRFKGIFRVCARGILQMYTATSGAGSLPSTSTAVLEMDCTAAGNSAIQLGGSTAALTGGTWTLNGQTRGTTGSITGATNATPIEITDTAHGYETGAGVVISGVTGNTAANGTWWITKTGANTYTLDNSVGNGTYGSGGTRVSRLASKMQTTTTIGTDTISMGCLVNTSTNTVTWIEGQKFDTGWTGKVSINGIIYTISSVTNTTTMVLTVSIGTLTAASFMKLGTGAPVTMNLADNSFLAVDDVIGTGTSSTRWQDGNVGLISSVGSSGQVTLKGPPCEYIVSVTNGSTTVKLARGQTLVTSGWTTTAATIDGNSVTITSVGAADTLTLSSNYAGTTNTLARLQITDTTKTQNCAYLSGLNDANGDVRAEVFLITRNVMVRSVAAPGITAGLYGLIQIGSTDAVVNWNYGEFSQLGSGGTTLCGMYLLNNIGTFNCNFCTIRDFWNTSSVINANINSGGGTYSFLNNFFHNMNGTFNISTGSAASAIVVGNIIHLNGSSVFGLVVSPSSTVSYNTFVCGNTRACISPNNSFSGIFTGSTRTHNTAHACSHFLGQSGNHYGEFRKTIIWRMSNASSVGMFLISGASGPVTFTDLVMFGITAVQGMILSSNGNLVLNRPIINAGVNVVSTQVFITGSGGSITVYDGEIGLVNSFSGFIGNWGVGAWQCIFYNTTFGGSLMIQSPTSATLGTSYTSIKHNGVAGDNRVWIPNGQSTSFTGHLVTDTSIYNKESPSLRCYPGSATFKIQSPVMYVPVKSGINPTISIKVRKSATGSGDSASYNGNQPRLVLLCNSALGYSYDTTLGYNMYSAVLATASGAAGSWETLTANLPTTPTEDGVVAVVVDMDGTAGWVNIDDFYVDSPNTSGTKYWHGDFAGPMQISGPEAAIVKRRRKAR